MPPSTSPSQILRSVFGYDTFRPLQKEVIEHLLAHRDTLAIMPTGGGKSLCYQIPALMFEGLTVVVSPLIALMKDQVEQLEALGVPALFLNSSLSFEDYQANLERVRSGEIKLLYVAPETLLTPRIFSLLDNLPLDCLTIDEAHCISEWGHDFRPEYRQLVGVRKRYPKAVCLALTATATPRVRQDIKATLGFQDDNEFIASFNRPNLFIEVIAKSDPGAQALEFLQRFPDQSGIVYCFSRRQVDELTDFLASRGYSALPYHAGLEDAVRKHNQEQFIRDDVQIIVATIAFGMGINKPNVRFILHYDLPKSIEGYYQEIGRAGRDGLPAHCLLLYSYGDVAKLRYFINQKEEIEQEVAEQHLRALIQYTESSACRRVPLLAYFGETFTTQNCEMCDNCRVGARIQVDITIPAQKFLSCVKRTGERFGAGHIIHVLVGSENDKVLSYGHQNLTTYGIGKDLTVKQWQSIAHQLVQKGLLAQSSGKYPTLQLTQSAYEALKNRSPILGVIKVEEPVKPAKKVGEVTYNPALFQILRAKRKELADADRVPPYVIFSDRTLAEMAAYFPQSRASLMKINGVGQVKLEHYGEIFLELIGEYCRTNNLGEKPKPSPQAVPASGQLPLNPRHMVVGEAYNNGQSVEALMASYGVKRSTIIDHLEKYSMEGHPLRNGGGFLELLDLPEQQVERAFGAFEELGTTYLKAIFESLNGSVSYDDLRILRMHYLSERETDDR